MQDRSVPSQRGVVTPEPLPNGNAASDPRPCARQSRRWITEARAEGRTASDSRAARFPDRDSPGLFG
jgi:hypothetical protein